MSQRADKAAGTRTFVLRLSVPAQGGLRAVAAECAIRVAAHLGADPDAGSAAEAVERLAERVAPAGVEGDITFEFSRADGDLVIRARCSGRSSEARHPLPA